jgi:hypothetical protein
MEGVVKKLILTNWIKSYLQSVVTLIVIKLLDSFKKEKKNERNSEKSNKQTIAINNLTNENGNLRQLMAGNRQKIDALEI